jgi:ketosteroid isomerase-like protein
VTDYLDPPFPAEDDRSARAASLRSRAAVHASDKSAWLALFSDDAVVQDPVGVSPLDETGEGHKGKDAIGEFWDTVIGPNSIQMHVRASRAGGDEVANELTIVTTFPDGSSAAVDLVAIYLVDEAGLISKLRAFWEFDDIRMTPAG